MYITKLPRLETRYTVDSDDTPYETLQTPHRERLVEWSDLSHTLTRNTIVMRSLPEGLLERDRSRSFVPALYSICRPIERARNRKDVSVAT